MTTTTTTDAGGIQPQARRSRRVGRDQPQPSPGGPQFFAIFCDFPQFSRFSCNCFSRVHVACVWVPCRPSRRAQRCTLAASLDAVLCSRFPARIQTMEMDLRHAMAHTATIAVDCVSPVQKCCPLRLREVWPTAPQFSRNFSQLDSTLPDRNPPPPSPLLRRTRDAADS